jgi:hypothetical protein
MDPASTGVRAAPHRTWWIAAFRGLLSAPATRAVGLGASIHGIGRPGGDSLRVASHQRESIERWVRISPVKVQR